MSKEKDLSSAGRKGGPMKGKLWVGILPRKSDRRKRGGAELLLTKKKGYTRSSGKGGRTQTTRG